jgi:hypothetical protein
MLCFSIFGSLQIYITERPPIVKYDKCRLRPKISSSINSLFIIFIFYSVYKRIRKTLPIVLIYEGKSSYCGCCSTCRQNLMFSYKSTKHYGSMWGKGECFCAPLRIGRTILENGGLLRYRVTPILIQQRKNRVYHESSLVVYLTKNM